MKTIQSLLLAVAFCLGGCGSTTYQKVVKAEAAAPPTEATSATAPLGGPCPTMAAKGSPAYQECERFLEKDPVEQLGIGGSGVPEPTPRSTCADPEMAKDPEVQRICELAK